MMSFSNPKLSKRLSCFAQFYNGEDVLWDVGCDHGHLGLSFIDHPSRPKVRLVDPSKAVVEKLQHKIKDSDIPRVEVFHQKGQDLKLEKELSHFIFIAGMGGPEIIKILENLIPQIKESDRVFISPHTKILDVREYLSSQGSLLHYEGVISEAGIWYPHLLLGPGGEKCGVYPHKLFMGPEGPHYLNHLLEKLVRHQDAQSKEFLNFLKGF